MDHKILFRYMLNDAWMQPIFELTIIDEPEKNVICESYEEPIINFIKTINIERVLEILNSNDKIFDIKEVPMPNVLDGVCDEFYFSNRERENSISTYNIDYYFKDSKAPQEAKIIIKTLEEIEAELFKINVPKKIDEYIHLK